MPPSGGLLPCSHRFLPVGAGKEFPMKGGERVNEGSFLPSGRIFLSAGNEGSFFPKGMSDPSFCGERVIPPSREWEEGVILRSPLVSVPAVGCPYTGCARSEAAAAQGGVVQPSLGLGLARVRVGAENACTTRQTGASRGIPPVWRSTQPGNVCSTPSPGRLWVAGHRREPGGHAAPGNTPARKQNAP